MAHRLPLTNPWTRAQYLRFFPQTPDSIYRALEASGFCGESYRNTWPDLVAALRQAGFALAGIHWHEPEESGFFQPIVTARKS